MCVKNTSLAIFSAYLPIALLQIYVLDSDTREITLKNCHVSLLPLMLMICEGFI